MDMPGMRHGMEAHTAGSAPSLASASVALLDLIDAAEDLTEILREARGEYTYEEIEEKRLVLGPGGKSGNCEYCVDASEEGWVDDGDVFEGPMGDEDGPPLHPFCECTLEYRTRRQRVYD